MFSPISNEDQEPIFSSEGVLIFPVKSKHAPNLSSSTPQSITPVMLGRKQIRGCSALGSGLARMFAMLLLAMAGSSAFAQTSTPPTTSPAATPAPAAGATIEQIRVIGNRRIPKETVLARLFTHPGDTYDPTSIERDFNSLWNTGYFDDLRIEREDSEKGLILNIYVREKPNIREINYKGNNSISQSDILDRFKKEKVSISQESQYDPTKIKRAETVLKELLAEHGHQFATIKTEVKTIPPASVQVNFNIKEGPTVKVGNIKFVGNQHISSLILRRSMRNLRPVGIPYSLVLENLFAKTFDSSKLEEDAERVRQAYRDKGYYNAAVEEPRTQIRDEGGLSLLTFRPNKGKRIDILMPVEEGERYRLSGITFTGNKAVSNTRALRATFAIKDGDLRQRHHRSKGIREPQESLRPARLH